MAHIRQSRPDSGLGFQVNVLQTFSPGRFSFIPRSQITNDLWGGIGQKAWEYRELLHADLGPLGPPPSEEGTT